MGAMQEPEGKDGTELGVPNRDRKNARAGAGEDSIKQLFVPRRRRSIKKLLGGWVGVGAEKKPETRFSLSSKKNGNEEEAKRGTVNGDISLENLVQRGGGFCRAKGDGKRMLTAPRHVWGKRA